MDPLPLEPDGYGGTYKAVAGQPSLDLINTLAWLGTDREHEWLDRPTNVTIWAAETGLIDETTRQRVDEDAIAHPTAAAADLAEIHHIRGVLRDSLYPLAHSSRPTTEAVAALSRLHQETCHRRSIDPSTLEWSWRHPEPRRLIDLMAPVIWNAAHVLTEVDHTRLGHCPSCDWVFHDTTRNHSRRWCDMADCGSRDKSLRHYHRTKSGQRG